MGRFFWFFKRRVTGSCGAIVYCEKCPECLLSEPFRTAVLVQQVMVVSILNGITHRVCIAAHLNEFLRPLGGIRVGFPVAGPVDVPADIHLLCLFRSEDFLVRLGLVLVLFGPFFLSVSYSTNDDIGQNQHANGNPGPAAGLPIPGLRYDYLLLAYSLHLSLTASSSRL